MKQLTVVVPLFLLWSVTPTFAQADYAPANIEMRETIADTVIDLRNNKAERDAAEKDLAVSQKELVEVESRMHTPEELKLLQDRVQKDRVGSWMFLQAMLKDLQYLRSQWGFLTPEEKAAVEGITWELTQGT